MASNLSIAPQGADGKDSTVPGPPGPPGNTGANELTLEQVVAVSIATSIALG